MKSVYLTTSIGAIYFFYYSVIISQGHLKQSICQGHCVYLITSVATIHIITNGLWLIREKLNDMFIGRKQLYPYSFKAYYLFHRTSCSNICLKRVMLNARKYLQPPHGLLVDMLIRNFTTVVAAIH